MRRDCESMINRKGKKEMNTGLIGLGRVVVLIIGLALLGAIYESVAEAAEQRQSPPS